MLNRIPSPSVHHLSGNGSPAVTSVRVRATSTQTDRPLNVLLHQSPVLLPAKMMSHQCYSQGTQTTVTPELSSEDNNNKVVVRALPRVVDVSHKPPKLVSKLVDLAHGKVNGSGSSWGDPDEERPSVEGGRRSYSSRIPTPIKPTVIPVTVATTPTFVNNNNNSSKTVVVASTTPSKRELPDIPVTKKSPLGVVTTPVNTKMYNQRGSKSEPANAVATTKVLASTSTPEIPQQQQQQQPNLLLHHPHHNTNHPRTVKTSFWGAWWRL